MRVLGILILLSGCGSVPMDGSLLEAVKPPAEVEPTSCQCNVYCAV